MKREIISKIIEETDFTSYDAKELVEKRESTQNRLMSKILEFYSLKDVELAVYKDYQFVIMIGFYPNVMLMVELLKREESPKVMDFLKLICDRYEDTFFHGARACLPGNFCAN